MPCLLYVSLGLAGIFLASACFLLRTLFPTPIPGIPYDTNATRSVLGDFPSFRAWYAQRPELYSWLASRTEALNSPIIQIFLRPLGKPWVVLSDHREAEDIMTRRTSEFGRAAVVGDFFAPLLPQWHTHMPTGDEWRAHRRLLSDLMAPSFLNHVVSQHTYDVTVHLVELWTLKADISRGRAFHVLDDIHHSALEIMWAAAFGSRIQATRAQFDALIINKPYGVVANAKSRSDEEAPMVFPKVPVPSTFGSIITLTRSIETALSSPFPRQHLTLLLKLSPQLRAATKVKNNLIKERLNKAWEKFSQGRDSGHVQSAAELIVEREVTAARKENRKPQYDTPVIRDELFGLLIAGLDTTSITVCWGLKFLTAHQRVQGKLRALLQIVYDQAKNANGLPSVQEIISTNVPYLDATIEEIHRLSGTVSANVRVALCDTNILGHIVPKGTDVFMV
jgi:cytochrome P450